MNKISQKEYQEIKNKTVTVISFENGQRTMTYGGLSYKQAIEETIRASMYGQTSLIVPQELANELKTKWDIEYYLNELEKYRSQGGV